MSRKKSVTKPDKVLKRFPDIVDLALTATDRDLKKNKNEMKLICERVEYSN